MADQRGTSVDAFPVRRVIMRANFADARQWKQTRKVPSHDHESDTVRVLAVHGEFHVEGPGGFPRNLYARAHSVSFVDVSVRCLELALDLGEQGPTARQARFGFACRTLDSLHAARTHQTNLFPELERYISLVWNRRIGYRTYPIGLTELQHMIFEYCEIRPPSIRGIRARLAYLDLAPKAEG
ncbi:hypothetical protein AB0K00_32195 [Dactylosporangium sp. NPDC049525]|uniref:hypothetical protein n=1 Tax=Dactylosporangium sp. NPDC049525 TaxID=3154730 RepID=UPI00341E787D